MPIWIARAPSSAAQKASALNGASARATAVPTATGTTAVVRVAGVQLVEGDDVEGVRHRDRHGALDLRDRHHVVARRDLLRDDPDDLRIEHAVGEADGRDAEPLGEQAQHVYAVRFDGRELWGDRAERGTSVTLDCFETYLEAEG